MGVKEVTDIPKLRPREADDHKGSFGHVLGIGGALGMSGALALAGRAAGRGGAGLVSLACPAPSQPIVAGMVPEALTIALPARDDGRIDPRPACDALDAQAGRWTVLAAGPGWGTADEPFADNSVALIERAAELVGGTAVIDADGLNLLAATGRLDADPWPNLVLTPHPGELARLLDCPIREIQSDRIAAAARATERFCGGSNEPEDTPVIVLKGHGTVVTDGQRYYVNQTGNPGMASGGAGDVLTGLVAALLGQGLDRFEAAVLAVHLHGLAGDLAAEQLGQISLLACDLLDALPDAVRQHHETEA